jgi:DNA-binding NarL/FixJ family response regulator
MNMMDSRQGGRANASLKTRIYLVDDHPYILEGLRSVLDQPGFEIVGETRTGREALREIHRLQPDVVVLDIRLSDMDGLKVLRLAKSDAPDTSFIIFTAFSEPSYLMGAVASGASGFAMKSDDSKSLVELIRHVAEGEECLPRSYWQSLLEKIERKNKILPGAESDDWPREQIQILYFMAHGKSNGAIAELLGLGTETVRFTLKKIFKKLGVSDRAHAVAQAIERDLIRLPNSKK